MMECALKPFCWRMRAAKYDVFSIWQMVKTVCEESISESRDRSWASGMFFVPGTGWEADFTAGRTSMIWELVSGRSDKPPAETPPRPAARALPPIPSSFPVSAFPSARSLVVSGSAFQFFVTALHTPLQKCAGSVTGSPACAASAPEMHHHGRDRV